MTATVAFGSLQTRHGSKNGCKLMIPDHPDHLSVQFSYSINVSQSCNTNYGHCTDAQ